MNKQTIKQIKSLVVIAIIISFILSNKPLYAQNSAKEKPSITSAQLIEKEDAKLWSETKEKAQKTLANLVNYALLPKKFDDVVEALDKQARNNIGDARHEKFSPLDTAQKEFQTKWKSKYRSGFSFGHGYGIGGDGNEDIIFDFKYGPISESHQMKISMAAEYGVPAANLVLVFEKFDKKLFFEGKGRAQWRINISENIKVNDLRQALLKEVEAINSEYEKWPVKELDAYKFIARRILQIFSIKKEKV